MRHSSSEQPPGSAPTKTITLKSLRNPPLSLSLQSQSLSTSIRELKVAVVKKLGGSVATENIRVLYKKKPCLDSRTVKEIVGEEDVGSEVNFSVMVIGGASGANQEGGKAPVSQGLSGEDVLGSEEFWGDLKGFLLQRVRDEGKAGEAWDVFREGWRKRRAP